MVKIGVSRDHPENHLSGINQCYPDAVLVAYTVRIPYAYRVERLAHAELVLRHVVHAYGRWVLCEPQGVVQGIAWNGHASCATLGEMDWPTTLR
jgi:hypothetical protein